MKRSTHYGAEESVVSIVLEKYRENLSWVTTDPNPLDAVGLADIKHVELYDKWRPLVPEPYWNEFVYFKEEPSNAKRQRVSQEKSQSKKARANRQRTETPSTTQQPLQTITHQAT